MAAATKNAAHCTAMPAPTHDFTDTRLARRYSTNERNVVRIIRFTTVFLDDMTPKKPREGWWVQPIARASSRVITIERGVAQTMKPRVRINNIGGTNFR